LRHRTLAINGVSKSYAMTGWRIGWIAGPRDLITAIETLLSQSAGNCCSISQAAAAAALRGDQAFDAQSVLTYKGRRDEALARINSIPGLSCRAPDGAFYLYVNCAGLIGKKTPDGKRLEVDGDVVLYFLESAGVALVAGAAYGLSPYFRLSIATSLETLIDGIERMASAVSNLR
jgi:aspartate aminotransferase